MWSSGLEEAAAGWVLLLKITEPLLPKEWDYRRISSLIEREKSPKQTENTKLSHRDAGKEPECFTQPGTGSETKEMQSVYNIYCF